MTAIYRQFTEEEIEEMAQSERCRRIQKTLNEHDARIRSEGGEIPRSNTL